MRGGFRPFGWLSAVAALAGGWLLLAGRVDLGEVVAATTAAVVAVTVAVLAHRHSHLEHRPDPMLLRLAGRLAVGMARDLWPCAQVLADRARGRGGAGEWLEVPFEADGADPDDVARRVALVVAGSLTATAYVAAVDADRSVVVVHRLVDTGRPVLPDELLGPA